MSSPAVKVKSVSLVMPTFKEAGHIQDLINDSAKALSGSVVWSEQFFRKRYFDVIGRLNFVERRREVGNK